MDAKRNRNKMLADTNESAYVWTGPNLTLLNARQALQCEFAAAKTSTLFYCEMSRSCMQ